MAMYLFLAFYTIEDKDNYISHWIYENYHLFRENWFWVLCWTLFFLVGLNDSSIKFASIDKPLTVKKEDRFKKLIIENFKRQLPEIINGIIYSNTFKRYSFDWDQKIKKIIEVKDVVFENADSVFIELSLNENLIDWVADLKRFDWTDWINSRGELKYFNNAAWRSKSWKNGIVIKVNEEKVDFSKTFDYPNLLVDSPLLKKPLDFTFWKNEKWVNGVFDLWDSPHLLVAWETQWWKSVAMTNILVSLMKNKLAWFPIDFKIIDPKRVEFWLYKNLKWIKVETNLDKWAKLIEWCVEEMERRYETLEKMELKNIKGYHDKWFDMNYIVVVIDEFWDIMTQWWDLAKSFEKNIIRLAQKARAVWIHLIIATQNPINTVITSNIKANLPSRIWFRTWDWIKSMTIIDDSILSTIKYKWEAYIKSWPSWIEHYKSFYINDDDLKWFIDFYKSKTEKSVLTVDHVSIDWPVVDHNLDQSIESPIEHHENTVRNILNTLWSDKVKFKSWVFFDSIEYECSYILIWELLKNNWYPNRDYLINIFKTYPITQKDIKSVISNLKSKWLLKQNLSNNKNILWGSIHNLDYVKNVYEEVFNVFKK